jgi:hypothetical protein
MHSSAYLRRFGCSPTGHIQDVSGWSMTVADAKGQSVFKIGFDLEPLTAKT